MPPDWVFTGYLKNKQVRLQKLFSHICCQCLPGMFERGQGTGVQWLGQGGEVLSSHVHGRDSDLPSTSFQL